MRERNYRTYRLLLLTDVIYYSVTSVAYGEHTCFAGTATVNRSPHWHSSCRRLETSAGSSTKNLVATSGRRHWPVCWCCPDCKPRSLDVEDATTLSWSSAAVSEWVSRGSKFTWHPLTNAAEIKKYGGLIRTQNTCIKYPNNTLV